MLPPGVLHMSAVGCFGRFTFSHLAFHIPTLAGSCLCLFCVVVCLVALFLCFWFLFCKCLGIPNSPRSLDLDDRQGLIARSAMQQKKKIHILPLSALHSRTPGQMYAFGLTYMLPLLPSFLLKMTMNCWMQHPTSTCLSPPQLAALLRIWNKLLMTCTLPPLNRSLLIPFFISPFPVCPSHTHGLSSPSISKTSSLSWIDTSLHT